MTTLFNALFKQKVVNALTQEYIDKEIRQVNLIRSFMMTGLAVPVALILSFTYSHAPSSNTVSFVNWERSILDLNLSIAVLSAVLFVFTLLAWIKPKYTYLNRYLPHVILLVMAVWGTICSIYNQAISTSIVTFLLICVVSSISLLIHPIRLFGYLIAIYLIFFIGVSTSDHDTNVLISNLAIGMITLFACLGLSIIQWRNNLTKIEQKALIKNQKKELEKNYKQLLITSAELQKANETKDKFFSILAHDLRGPITSTLALTHFLEDSFFDSDEEERKRLFMLLQSSLDTTAKLLENILLWSRSQTGDITFKPVPMKLFDCVQSNIEFLKIVAAQKDIKITNLVDPTIAILADADMMNTIFRNLISNAIKFTRNFGLVQVKSFFENGADDGKKQLSVSVLDNGIGMSEKLLNNLFLVEKKSAVPGTNKEMGTGLGLVLCKEFIHKHNGSIRVESCLDLGSTFTITLPI
jgi:two-component system sensor histidine kinase/response regulator